MTYDSVLDRFLHALAEEFARMEFQMTLLMREKDTLTTETLITRHEKDFGLPNDYLEIATTLGERRALLNAQLIARGRMDEAYFVELATTMGHTIKIITFLPCVCGACETGHNNCGGDLLRFYVGVIVYYNHGNITIAEPYEITGLANLIGIFDLYKPAHIIFLWGFYGPDYSNAFDFSFNSMPTNALPEEWDGGFEYDPFTSAFARDHGYNLPAYLGGDFPLGFNNSFDVNRYISGGGYFGAPFSLAFDTDFDIYLGA